MTQVVVLGWDALDIALIERFGLGGRFGAHARRIETYANPVTNEPHTKELWPSILTGLHPDDHGIHAVSESGGVEWGNPALDLASTAASAAIPHRVRSYLGARLRERGASLDSKRAAYYDEAGLPTIFDDPASRPISIPNYQTAFDRNHDLDANRDGVWASLLDSHGSGKYDPGLSTPGVYDILGRELGRRLGHTLAAIQQGTPLVFCWFGLLDTVGHMAPAVDAAIERDWYTAAANATEAVREAAGAETVVLSISDHGLQNGEHTHYATLCSDRADATDRIESIFDVRGYIAHLAPDGTATAGGIDNAEMADVHDQLEQLGYV